MQAIHQHTRLRVATLCAESVTLKMIQSLYDDSYDVVVCTAGALGKPYSYRQCWDLKLHTYRGLFTLIRMQHRCNDFKRKLKKISKKLVLTKQKKNYVHVFLIFLNLFQWQFSVQNNDRIRIRVDNLCMANSFGYGPTVSDLQFSLQFFSSRF